MDPRLNPYTPNAGAMPAVLSGRQAQQDAFDVLLSRLAAGRTDRSLLLTGLRGVGKTVLLSAFRDIAVEHEWAVVSAEIEDETDFRYVLAELTRDALYQVSPPSKWLAKAKRAAGVLRAFAVTMSPDGSIALSLRDTDMVAGPADTGDLSYDAPNLFEALGEAARENRKGVVLLIDEAQFLDRRALTGLLMSIHRITQRGLPVTLIAAGLPQVIGRVSEARGYAERLFEVLSLGALSAPDAEQALVGPAAKHLKYSPDAVARVIDISKGYPFFLQEYGSVLWEIVPRSPVTVDHVDEALPIVHARLDKNFFAIRAGTLTETETRYLRAMAELPGSGPWKSGEIAIQMGLKSSAESAAVRSALLAKSIIYSPRHGETAFTVPHFDDYLRRTYPFEKHVPVPRKHRRAS